MMMMAANLQGGTFMLTFELCDINGLRTLIEQVVVGVIEVLTFLGVGGLFGI